MPNWCYTDYVVTGPKEQVQRLKETMRRLEAMPTPGLVENGFGSTWLGNLVTELGEDWNKIYCRGTWDSVEEWDENVLFFMTETAWGEMDEVRHLIERKFPGIKIYFQAEEMGMCVFETNDRDHDYFSAGYYLWIEDDDDPDGDLYDSLEEVIDKVTEITKCEDLHTFADCKNALERHFEDSEICYTCMPITYVD